MRKLRTVLPVALVCTGLLVGGSPSVHAAVGNDDVPSKAQLVKLFPALKGGDFESKTARKVNEPVKKCGKSKLVKVKSGRVLLAINHDKGVVADVQVGQYPSAKRAKKAFKKWKRFATTCKTFEVFDIRGTNKVVRVPKVGQNRVGYVQTAKMSGATTHGFVIVVRRGKRIAVADVAQGPKVAKKKRNAYTKLVAKRMK